MKKPLKFPFSETKAIEALAFIAQECPGLSALYVSKVLFFAEKWHLNRYGRPILADTYIAMPKGPVPSTVKNFIDHKWDWVDEPESFRAAVKIVSDRGLRRLVAGSRPPNLSVLSKSDIECLKESIAFCKDKQASELSNITHMDKAWILAAQNGPMDYADFVDDENPNKEEILVLASENAFCGIL